MVAATVAAEDLTVEGSRLFDISPCGRLAEIDASGIPLYLWTSWFDGGYAASALAQMESGTSPVRVIIGPWSHGAATPMLGSPFAPEAPMSPTIDEQVEMMTAFLLRHLHGEGPPEPPPSRLRYYTMAEEAWHEADSWPPPGVVPEPWYLAADGVLSPESPSDRPARDEYVVDFEATTGTQTRWHTLIGGPPVVYPERAAADRRLLTFTSAPMAGDMEVTGTPVVTLHVTSTHDDGNFFVYLEDVAPDGHVTYVTEGMLRAIHRRASDDPPYAAFGPYHTLSRDDVEPLVPGVVTELAFTLFPTSVLFRRGHCVRIAIAGHDNDLFRRVPDTGDPAITIERSATYPSHILLPVMGARGQVDRG
jgi:putative CocE/NonD family hydrolase